MEEMGFKTFQEMRGDNAFLFPKVSFEDQGLIFCK